MTLDSLRSSCQPKQTSEYRANMFVLWGMSEEANLFLLNFMHHTTLYIYIYLYLYLYKWSPSPPRSTYLIFSWYLQYKMLILSRQKTICFLFSFQSTILKNIQKPIVLHVFLYTYLKTLKGLQFLAFLYDLGITSKRKK